MAAERGSGGRFTGPRSVPWDEVRTAYEAGEETMQELTRRFGCSARQLTRRKSREGWEQRRPEIALATSLGRLLAEGGGGGSLRPAQTALMRTLTAAAVRFEYRMRCETGPPDADDLRALTALTNALSRLSSLDDQTEGDREHKHADAPGGERDQRVGSALLEALETLVAGRAAGLADPPDD